MAKVRKVLGQRQPLPGLGATKGHGDRSKLPESQQPLQRPPCLLLWAGHKRFEQSSSTSSTLASVERLHSRLLPVGDRWAWAIGP